MGTDSQNAINTISSLWRTLYIIAETIVILLDIALLGVIIYVLPKILVFRPRFGMKRQTAKTFITLEKAQILERWAKIAQKTEGENIDLLRVAIIEADAFVDDIFKQIGIPGEHFSDRLSNVASDNLTTVENLWRAHRTRNSLVHTPGYIIELREAKTTIRYYKEFLKEIGILQ
jgi:hypothetical protein